VKFFD